MVLTSSKSSHGGLEPDFNEPRLKLSILGRLLVRAVSYITYLVLGAGFLVLLLSPLVWVKAGGIFLGLFLIDRLIHRNWADRPLYELPRAGRVNVARYFRPRTLMVLEKAMDRTFVLRGSFGLEVVKSLLNMKLVREGILRMDLDPREMEDKLIDFLKESRELGVSGRERTREQIRVLAVAAFYEATSNAHRFVEIGDVFTALFSLKDSYLERLFNLFEIERGDLSRAILFSTLKAEFSRLRRVPLSLGGFIFGLDRRVRHRVMNRAWTSRPTPILDRFSIDFTDLARREEVGFLVGHKEEYNRLVDTLARPVNPNALLIGEEGVGKETIVAYLAFQLIKDEVPQPLFDKRLVMIQLSSLVAGATPDELQERLKGITEEIVTAGNVILYIPGIHNLVKTSGENYLSVADALMPIVNDNAFPVIGSTYPREFKEFLEGRSDVVGAFEMIRVQEISEAEAEKLLVYQSLILERVTGIVISFGAIKMAVKLARKYLRNKFLPSSGGELLKSALASAGRKGGKILKPEMVVEVLEEKVNIPIHKTSREESQKLVNLEQLIHERLVDQNEAVQAVSEVLRAYRSGLGETGKPIAAFLFIGPTGVGKTELAKILAEIQFGSEKMMIRFDMTEYQDKQSFYRFIGSPDGMVSGALTDAVLKQPYALILLDEFEKAFPGILDLFLQVFDDGRLTDNLGRTVSFEDTLIIATSNAHSDIVSESLRKGQAISSVAEYLKLRLVDVFKPELLNRFSKIVVFNNLSSADLRKIARLRLERFGGVAKERGVELSFDQEVVWEVARLGYDPAYGARPLERVIAERLRAPLASELLKKNIVKGNRVRVVLKGDKFEFVREGD